ncbi:MAG: winged helix-turn-helix transcriptional regulator [Verrucomicrobia bacterium]|nr:winged helix-turn-helix transcriptional regulator [Verrucomicrobiota bacterium]MCH8511540.1 winged helix-turn-helix domain-containing protein [Kiritimatiellia bacterium]
MQLNDYKLEFRKRMLDLAWRQWVALGLQGYGAKWKHSPIDPEALIMFTCEVGRRDQRLFDGMVEWVERNGRWINVSRAKRLLRETKVVPYKLFLGLVERGDPTLTSKFKAIQTWGSDEIQPMPLFLGPDAEPMPTGRTLDPVFQQWGFLRNTYENRKICGPFPGVGAETLLLRLRAFTGLNARAELLNYLLLHSSGSPRAMARACGYGAPTVTLALSEMSESGWVDLQSDGRRVLYSLRDREKWWSLLVGWPGIPKGVDWVAVMPALCQLHVMLEEACRDEASPRQQASRLRRFLESKSLQGLNLVAPELRIGGNRLPSGEELIPVFQQQVDQILDRLMEGQP